MGNMMNQVGPLLNSMVITLIYFYFLNQMYSEGKNRGKLIFLATYILSAALIFFTVMLRIQLINIVRSIIIINVLCLLLYHVELRTAIIYNTIFVLSSIFIDTMVALLVSALVNESLQEILGDNRIVMVSSAVYWIFSFLMCKLCVYIFKRKSQNTVQNKEMVFLLLITLFEIFLTTYIISLIDSASQGTFLIVILCGFLALNIYFAGLLEQIEKVARLRGKLELSAQQSSIQLKCYQEIMEREEMSRKTAHDIRHHLQVLNDLYVTGQRSEAQDYKNILNEKIDELSNRFRCSSPILSVIINHQLQKAQINGIDLNLKVEDVPLYFIDNLDMTAIFANLLDNAIDACCELKEDNRRIDFKMWQFNEFIGINISNPVKVCPKKLGKVFISSKPGHRGIGLTNVLNAVNKYDGQFIVDADDDSFVAKIIISIPN